MTELIYAGDNLKFNKDDIKALIHQLSPKDKQVLKTNITQKIHEGETNLFPYIRSWVLHKFYPEKFKKGMPFYSEVLDILNEE